MEGYVFVSYDDIYDNGWDKYDNTGWIESEDETGCYIPDTNGDHMITIEDFVETPDVPLRPSQQEIGG